MALARGDLAEAVDSLQDAADRWTVLRVPYEVATAKTLLGQSLRGRGNEAGAAPSFEAAARLFDGIGGHVEA